MDPNYTIANATADMDAVLADVRVAYEAELGSEGWWAKESFTTECTEGGTARYWGENRGVDRAVPPDRWPALWDRLVTTAAEHRFTAPSEDPADGGDHFIRIRNAHGDSITVATTQGQGSAFGGETVCHPGDDTSPSPQP